MIVNRKSCFYKNWSQMLGKTLQRFAKDNCKEPGESQKPSRVCPKSTWWETKFSFHLKRPKLEIAANALWVVYVWKTPTSGVCLQAKFSTSAVFINKASLEDSHASIYLLSVAAFPLPWQSWVVAAEKLWPAKPKIFSLALHRKSSLSRLIWKN